MADRTTGALPPVKEAEIGQLPGIGELYDDTLIPVEQQGEARHMTGAQWKKYAKESVDADTNSAKEAAKTATEAANSILNMTVGAETLYPGSQASVRKTSSGGVAHLLFGIPRGVDGTSFTVNGRYDTLPQLEAEHPTGKEGEAYAVGTPDDNVVYIWDTDKKKWEPIGKIQGAPGKDGLPGADGKSAYQVAVDNGFPGTEQEWLDSLKGGGSGGSTTLPDNIVTADGGGELLLTEMLGSGPYEIRFTEEESSGNETGGEEVDLSLYATKQNPVFTGSVSMGRAGNHPTGSNSVALGYLVTASGQYSAAFGYQCQANGGRSHAEGDLTIADGSASHAEGETTTANGRASHVEGYGSVADGDYSHAGGMFTTASELEYTIGTFNIISQGNTSDTGNRLVIGNGNGTSFRSNAFRVHSSGDVYGGQYHSSGADYAEIYEWLDGNPSEEDRVGRFVVLDGEHIRLASPSDNPKDILGIVSASPSIAGDSYEDQWRGMYLRDIFGRVKIGQDKKPILNPEYDPEQVYIPQSRRAEKAPIGLLGKLVMVDDGSCKVNGWCSAGAGGAAAFSKSRTRFRVMSRLDGAHIRVNIMMQ